MAAISRRFSRGTPTTWRATVRVRGFKSETCSFPTEEEARAWATAMETKLKAVRDNRRVVEAGDTEGLKPSGASRAGSNPAAPRYRERLTLKERKRLESLLAQGMPLKIVAQHIGRSYSGLKTEVRRGGGVTAYDAERAHSDALERQARIGHGQIGFTNEQGDLIRKMVKEGAAPCKIADALGYTYNAVLAWISRHAVAELYEEIHALRVAFSELSIRVKGLEVMAKADMV